MHLSSVEALTNEDVLARQGLYPAGTVTEQSVIDTLRANKIHYVWVEDDIVEMDVDMTLISKGYLYADSVIYPILAMSSVIPDVLQQMLATDNVTLYHSINVAIISQYIARVLGFKEDNIKEVITAALLHDIGKLQIPHSILQKKGQLTADEFTKVKEHPLVGYEILSQYPMFSDDIKRGVLEHHEKWAGNGYPFNLSGFNIHMYARIIAIADVYDALVSKRSYKTEMTTDQAIKEMLKDVGHFEPSILNRFVDSIEHTSSFGVDILRIS